MQQIDCPTRAVQVAECTARSEFLEAAKDYEQMGDEFFHRACGIDPAYAYAFKLVCTRQAERLRELERGLR